MQVCSWKEGILRAINSRGLTPDGVQDARIGKKYTNVVIIIIIAIEVKVPLHASSYVCDILEPNDAVYLGAFANFRKATISFVMCVCLSVCLSDCPPGGYPIAVKYIIYIILYII